MSDLFGNHIVGFLASRLIFVSSDFILISFYLTLHLFNLVKHFLSSNRIAERYEPRHEKANNLVSE